MTEPVEVIMNAAIDRVAPRRGATRLWAPFEVADLAASRAFYTGLGLSEVDSWRTEAEQGAVFAAGDGRVELVQTLAPDHPPGHAIELATWADVDELADRTGARPKVFARGHYGFTVSDPDGNELLMWSEKR